MGLFPYTCEACGGGYERCGVVEHKNCSGGQFCYEDNVVIFVNEERFDGVYNGYGQVETSDHDIYIPSEFNEFIDDWNIELTYDPKQTCVMIYCRGCFEKK